MKEIKYNGIHEKERNNSSQTIIHKILLFTLIKTTLAIALFLLFASFSYAGTITWQNGSLNVNNSFYVTNDGKVGIGTTAPVQKLTLNGGTFLQTPNGTLIVLGGIDLGVAVSIYSGVFVAGKYAYLGLAAGGGNEFEIVDISNVTGPNSITVNNVSGIDMGVQVNGIYVAGKYAYLTLDSSPNSFEIVDISNVTAPKNVSSINLGNVGLDVFVSGKYAYVGVGGSTSNFKIVDISNPFNPVPVSTLTVGGNQINRVKVVGKYAYVTLSGSLSAGAAGYEFAIIDISDPTNPVVVGGIDTGIAVPALDVSGRYAYLGWNNNPGNDLLIVDVLDPTNPKNVSGIDFGDNVNAISVQGKYAYLGMGSPPHFRVVDISNPLSPVIVSSTSIANTGSVFVSGKYAYVGTAAFGGNEFQIVDLNGIDAPAASIGTISTTYLAVQDNARIENNLYVRTGLDVGTGGILSQGPLSITGNTNSSSSFTLRISNSNGTTGAPLLSLRDDGLLNLSNGLFSVSNNVLSISGANGVNINLNGSLFINTTSGNVGIGITFPTQTLDVIGTLSVKSSYLGNAQGLFQNADGKVGIGTASPGALLDINAGKSPANGWSGGWQNNLRLQASHYPSLRFYSTNSSKSSGIGTNNDGSLWFFINGAGDAYSALGMVIHPSGNVGIGTTNPLQKLDVKGDISFIKSCPTDMKKLGKDPTAFCFENSLRPSDNIANAVQLCRDQGRRLCTGEEIIYACRKGITTSGTYELTGEFDISAVDPFQIYSAAMGGNLADCGSQGATKTGAYRCCSK